MPMIGGSAEFNTIIAFGDSYSSVCGSHSIRPFNNCITWSSFDDGGTVDSLLQVSEPAGKGLNYLNILTDCKIESPLQCSVRLIDLAVGSAFIGGPFVKDREGSHFLSQQYSWFFNHVHRNVPWNPARTLFINWIGINDITSVLFMGLNDADIQASFGYSIRQNMQHLRDLFAVGAEHLILLNVPDRAMSPWFKLHPQYKITAATKLWNILMERHVQMLAEEVNLARAVGKQISIRIFDVAQLVEEMITEPERYQITDTESICYPQDPCPEGILWWDDQHLAEGAHRVIARSLQKFIDDGSGRIARSWYPDKFVFSSWTLLALLSISIIFIQCVRRRGRYRMLH